MGRLHSFCVGILGPALCYPGLCPLRSSSSQGGQGQPPSLYITVTGEGGGAVPSPQLTRSSEGDHDQVLCSHHSLREVEVKAKSLVHITTSRSPAHTTVITKSGSNLQPTQPPQGGQCQVPNTHNRQKEVRIKSQGGQGKKIHGSHNLVRVKSPDHITFTGRS